MFEAPGFFRQSPLSGGALTPRAADGVLEGLFVYVLLRLHHSGFYESCFGGRQTFPPLLHYSINLNKHLELPKSIHTRFFLYISFFPPPFFLLMTASCAWDVSNGLSVAPMLSRILEWLEPGPITFRHGRHCVLWCSGGMNCDTHPVIPQIGSHVSQVYFEECGWVGSTSSWAVAFASRTAYSCCAGLKLSRIHVCNGEMFSESHSLLPSLRRVSSCPGAWRWVWRDHSP